MPPKTVSYTHLDVYKRQEEQYPEEFKAMVIQVAMELQGKVKEKTPKKTSWLQNNWKVGEVRKRGDEYVIEVYNNVEYAEAVEWGHRQKRCV